MLSSQERRIKLGEKRKLQELKKKTGFEVRKSRVLKEGRHFDSIMDEQTELGGGKGGASGAAKDNKPQDDINSLEFSLAVDAKALQRELAAHKLNSTVAAVVKMVLAAGLYPQYAAVEPTNNFRTGHDQFAHTLAKPFVVLHPNSSLGQVPEALRLDLEKGGRSAFHQLVYYGLLLETTKPYLCNSSRIPFTFLLVTARNVRYTIPYTIPVVYIVVRVQVTAVNENALSCDGFVELTFDTEHACTKVLRKAVDIREQLLHSIDKKLKMDDYGSYRELEKAIVRFSQYDYPFSVRRMIDPPKGLRCGIFDGEGGDHTMVRKEDEPMLVRGEEKEEADEEALAIGLEELGLPGVDEAVGFFGREAVVCEEFFEGGEGVGGIDGEVGGEFLNNLHV